MGGSEKWLEAMHISVHSAEHTITAVPVRIQYIAIVATASVGAWGVVASLGTIVTQIRALIFI